MIFFEENMLCRSVKNTLELEYGVITIEAYYL